MHIRSRIRFEGQAVQGKSNTKIIKRVPKYLQGHATPAKVRTRLEADFRFRHLGRSRNGHRRISDVWPEDQG